MIFITHHDHDGGDESRDQRCSDRRYELHDDRDNRYWLHGKHFGLQYECEPKYSLHHSSDRGRAKLKISKINCSFRIQKLFG